MQASADAAVSMMMVSASSARCKILATIGPILTRQDLHHPLGAFGRAVHLLLRAAELGLRLGRLRLS